MLALYALEDDADEPVAVLRSGWGGGAASDIPEVMHGVVDEIAGQGLHGEAGAVAAVARPVPLIAGNTLETIGDHLG